MLREGDGNLLSLVPADAYRKRITPLGYSRRSIILVNDPAAIREVMTDPLAIFPKNDLFVGALGPLVGDSVFVSEGATWQRQRDMIDPAFSHMRIDQSFAAMSAAVDTCEDTLSVAASNGRAVSLDVTMSQLTADVICRTIFSQPLLPERAASVFEAFSAFERSVASVSAVPLLAGKPWAAVKQPQRMLDACERIRGYIAELVDPRLAASAGNTHQDILAAVMSARDTESGKGFTRSELIDQIGVFFLAGHETTASALTWAFYILAMQPQILARLRAEVAAVAGNGPITLEHIKPLLFTRSVFREVLRLYPPITFIPRVAAESTTIAGVRVKRGAMVMISPWATHRNALLWRDADRFDPDRFASEQASNNNASGSGPFLTFGMGPRVCVGIAFATMESSLILARLCRRFDLIPQDPASVRPVARLTTRPAQPIQVRIRERKPQ